MRSHALSTADRRGTISIKASVRCGTARGAGETVTTRALLGSAWYVEKKLFSDTMLYIVVHILLIECGRRHTQKWAVRFFSNFPTTCLLPVFAQRYLMYI